MPLRVRSGMRSWSPCRLSVKRLPLLDQGATTAECRRGGSQVRSGGSCRGEALPRPLASPFRLDLAVPGRRGRDQRVKQPHRRGGDLLDGSLERGLVGLGWLGGSADLAHVLERRGANLLVGRGRLEV